MADVDTDPFGEHESRTDEPTDEDIPLIPGEGGVPTWDLECEQETSFGGEQETSLERLKAKGESLTNLLVDTWYDELSEHYSRTSDAIHYDTFERKGTRLYVKGKQESLTDRLGNLKKDTELEQILGKNRLFELGFKATNWPKAKNAEALKIAKDCLLGHT